MSIPPTISRFVGTKAESRNGSGTASPVSKLSSNRVSHSMANAVSRKEAHQDAVKNRRLNHHGTERVVSSPFRRMSDVSTYVVWLSTLRRSPRVPRLSYLLRLLPDIPSTVFGHS